MPASVEARLRGVLSGVAAAVYAGAAVELGLVEHWAEWEQVIPFVLLSLGLAAVAWGWRRPSARSLRMVRGVSALVVVGSVVGVGLHVWGNVEFAREVTPGAGLWALAWDGATGASPLLAPGMLAVAAVLATAATLRHPALSG